MRRALILALAAALATPALAQEGPWDRDFLPPAPAWKGKSERLMVRADDPWITPSEKTGLTATPSYAETMAFIARMDAASDLIRVETFGKSAQGRDLVAVLVSRDGAAFDPAKPVMLFQGGIHSGEIDGKDAGLMLLRDIAFRGKGDLLDKVNLVFVPIFNVDGHERSGPYSRPNQRGPVNQGWRTTAQNLNLNRDYGKADTPEMRAMLGLIQRYRPDLYLDLHVTDGVDYAYDITYGFAAYQGRYARSPDIGKWLEGPYSRQLDAGLKAAGHIPGPLIFAVDDRNIEAGMAATASPPRFSTGYGDAVGLATVLVENHSLKPYKQRVLGTYVLLESSIRALAEHGEALRAAAAADRARRVATITASWKLPTAPEGAREHLPVAYELYDSPASGRKEVRWLGKVGKPIQVPVFYSQPGVQIMRPDAYWIPATKPEVIDRLRAHGVEMEVIDRPRTVSVEMYRLKDVKPEGVLEGRVRMAGAVGERMRRNEVYPAGSARIPTDQPLGVLAMLLLEPEAEESLFGWGFFPELAQRTEYIEGYAIAPLAERMLAADPKLRAEFEARLAADPEFAKSPDARLAWFYERTPYYDDRYLLYPVGREVNLD